MTDTIWMTKDGKKARVVDLENSHLVNIERFLTFRGTTAPGHHPGFFANRLDAVREEMRLRQLDPAPTIKEHPIPPCPWEQFHSNAVDIEDAYPCWFCS